jgi:hypothetical protein
MSGGGGKGISYLLVRVLQGPILAIPDEDWHVQFSVGLKHTQYFSFTATMDNGQSVMVTKFPAVETHLDGYEEVTASYRLLINGLVPNGKPGEQPAVKKLYEAIERRLSRRLTLFVEDQKRIAKENEEKDTARKPVPPAGAGLLSRQG